MKKRWIDKLKNPVEIDRIDRHSFEHHGSVSIELHGFR
jgi:hypothetical protein